MARELHSKTISKFISGIFIFHSVDSKMKDLPAVGHWPAADRFGQAADGFDQRPHEQNKVKKTFRIWLHHSVGPKTEDLPVGGCWLAPNGHQPVARGRWPKVL